MEVVAKYGESVSWTRIAAEIPGGTDAQCRRRWEADTGKTLRIVSRGNSEEEGRKTSEEQRPTKENVAQIEEAVPSGSRKR